ncbi:MASE2 domain-containing protein, partial [Escherichia coli]|uniref:MASE2 domain-containing protein n=1 Tax=Escherichia coli TaxID=562 RepID=UPI0022A1D0F6|nr:hypothetical protein [Escherichia coli]
MFPKIMNDENFFKKAAAHGEEPPLTPQNEHQRSGLRFARRVRLPRAVGLAGMFLPIASTLVSHPPPGWWWLVLVGWAFVWPHLAWQIASRAVDPLSREIYKLNLQSKCNKKRSTHQLEYNFVSTQKPLPNDEYFLPTSYNKRA